MESHIQEIFGSGNNIDMNLITRELQMRNNHGEGEIMFKTED